VLPGNALKIAHRLKSHTSWIRLTRRAPKGWRLCANMPSETCGPCALPSTMPSQTGSHQERQKGSCHCRTLPGARASEPTCRASPGGHGRGSWWRVPH
jgi:hypothetical protein